MSYSIAAFVLIVVYNIILGAVRTAPRSLAKLITMILSIIIAAVGASFSEAQYPLILTEYVQVSLEFAIKMTEWFGAGALNFTYKTLCLDVYSVFRMLILFLIINKVFDILCKLVYKIVDSKPKSKTADTSTKGLSCVFGGIIGAFVGVIQMILIYSPVAELISEFVK